MNACNYDWPRKGPIAIVRSAARRGADRTAHARCVCKSSQQHDHYTFRCSTSHWHGDWQRLLVQRTLAELFAHRVSWYDGLVTICSDAPIEVDEAILDAWMARPDVLSQQMRVLDASLRAEGRGGLIGLYDGADALPLVADRPITDDWPLLEYPALAEAIVEAVPVDRIR